jgi:poly(3-hydroxybutyrate) depolymerase
VEGYREASLHVPRGAVNPRPVLVALHGNFDRPEWQCDVWRGITRGYPFILCPRGIPRRDAPANLDRWEYGNADTMERELEAGLAALSARYGAHVDPGPVIYTGFSLGGIMGVRVLRRKSGRFPIAVLTEGGFESWTPAFARSFKEGGGQRILFACGQVDCMLRSKTSVAALTKAGVEAKTVSGGKVGHRYDGPVADAIAAEWAWLVASDPRWPTAEQK